MLEKSENRTIFSDLGTRSKELHKGDYNDFKNCHFIFRIF
jgi:hypothetical protein